MIKKKICIWFRNHIKKIYVFKVDICQEEFILLLIKKII